MVVIVKHYSHFLYKNNKLTSVSSVKYLDCVDIPIVDNTIDKECKFEKTIVIVAKSEDLLTLSQSQL